MTNFDNWQRPLVPLDKMEEVWVDTIIVSPEGEYVVKYMDYMTITWIEGLLDRLSGNHFVNYDHKTNNLEGWHHKMDSLNHAISTFMTLYTWSSGTNGILLTPMCEYMTHFIDNNLFIPCNLVSGLLHSLMLPCVIHIISRSLLSILLMKCQEDQISYPQMSCVLVLPSSECLSKTPMCDCIAFYNCNTICANGRIKLFTYHE